MELIQDMGDITEGFIVLRKINGGRDAPTFLEERLKFLL